MRDTSRLWQFCHILYCVGSMLFFRFTSLIEIIALITKGLPIA
jgi:hypothetical protein